MEHRLAGLVAVLGLSAGPVAAQAETKTLHYPTQGTAMFSIQVAATAALGSLRSAAAE